MRQPRLPIRNDQRGISAVEFAFVLPVLVALVCGVVEYGWFMKTRMALHHAVSEGARAAIAKPTFAQRRTTAIFRTKAALSGLTHADMGTAAESFIVVDESPETAELPKRLSVSVKNWPYTPLTGLIPVPATVLATAVMALPN